MSETKGCTSPKFEVGEFVGVESSYNPFCNCSRTQVILCEWQDGLNTAGYKGWGYKTVHMGNGNGLLAEDSLRKLPPEEKGSWKNCEWQPKEVVKNE